MNTEANIYDVLVVGGGINGVGIASDAAGRGLKVALCEMNDLASATSSNSSKLIHGGLRYLEYYEFRLVREALAEREVLLKNAPHIIWPLRFRLPHRPHLRPALMIRAGLFLYDHLSKRATLKGSHGIKFSADGPLVPGIKKGFEYSDGWVDDARLVTLNAIAAREKGARISTRCRCVKAERNEGIWEVTLENQLTGEQEIIQARALVNAAGPWVASLFDTAMSTPSPKNIRLVKGSHIIVPRIHDEDEAYILQNEDNRIVFVIPYEGQFSLIGTTDVEHKGEPSTAAISDEEIDYLIEVTNQHFTKKISRDDVVRTYAGVRPLLDDEAENPQAVTRDYTFEIDHQNGKAPLLSVFGGKITTYRKLSEAAMNSLKEFFPKAGSAWTASAPLPGGNFDNPLTLQKKLCKQYSWLPLSITKRYVRSYGTISHQILGNCNSIEDLGRHFGAGLYQREVDYLIQQEWTLTLEDLIWRRSKLGLFLNQSEQADLDAYLQEAASTNKLITPQNLSAAYQQTGS
ncbi:glycerol-3-phosphate dehydrogenase [Motiliproteus sp. MSK22-1]|uniref:glycerol-3-phosphate dehydrogenase n=1 Tax=Motiliproteus sp. MSK22-1 TaxID=1897630 RepID=UPI0009788F74|nr:glycerol-3-phosphate dehydrogenase [Motiliproteus sp. MSK22-1]OMH33788.1 glycerol-3-phosphate dehydrogenase [Motiliproteus sp. MSK22-1]